ncbi:hypothetical protein J6590_088411 [Homalodisca vitripennis]|nr:hypothetical protein J6590_088411 [Homalodisca vitripennis]
MFPSVFDNNLGMFWNLILYRNNQLRLWHTQVASLTMKVNASLTRVFDEVPDTVLSGLYPNAV